jgi:hypothetical protein
LFALDCYPCAVDTLLSFCKSYYSKAFHLCIIITKTTGKILAIYLYIPLFCLLVLFQVSGLPELQLAVVGDRHQLAAQRMMRDSNHFALRYLQNVLELASRCVKGINYSVLAHTVDPFT